MPAPWGFLGLPCLSRPRSVAHGASGAPLPNYAGSLGHSGRPLPNYACSLGLSEASLPNYAGSLGSLGLLGAFGLPRPPSGSSRHRLILEVVGKFMGLP